MGPWSDLHALGMVAYRCVSGLGGGELPDAVTRARTQRKGGQDLAPAAEVGKGVYDAQFLTAIDWATQTRRIGWGSMAGITRTQECIRTQWDRSSRMRGDCLICMGTCGSG